MESHYLPPTESLGERLFRMRDYTPVPLVLLLLMVQKPSIFSVTLGVLTVVLGQLLRVYGVAFIGSISRTRKSSLGAELVTGGPFAWVRNPLYVANFFVVLGFSIYANRFWLLLLSMGLFAFQYHFIVRYEEQNLEEKFGQAFRDYKQQVPAWFPKKIPAITSWEWPPSL